MMRDHEFGYKGTIADSTDTDHVRIIASYSF